MNTERLRELETQVDDALRVFARRCRTTDVAHLDELRADIIALARHHAARTVHEAVIRRTDCSRKRRYSR
jgi:hypothetical protein